MGQNSNKAPLKRALSPPHSKHIRNEENKLGDNLIYHGVCFNKVGDNFLHMGSTYDGIKLSTPTDGYLQSEAALRHACACFLLQNNKYQTHASS